MIRAFIAIPLPEDSIDQLARLQSELAVGRPVNPDNFHITLAYLDRQKPEVLARIDEALRQIRVSPFDLVIRGTGVFGGRAPSAIWAGIEPNSALDHLREKVLNASRRNGIKLSRDRFRPHVTLARLKGRSRPQDHKRIQAFLAEFGIVRLPPFSVTEFVLYQSTLHPDGSIYDPMTLYPLQAAGTPAEGC